jgi:hypothetical protein
MGYVAWDLRSKVEDGDMAAAAIRKKWRRRCSREIGRDMSTWPAVELFGLQTVGGFLCSSLVLGGGECC